MAAIPRYLLVNAVMGVLIGLLFGLALLTTDALGIRSLVGASSDVASTIMIVLAGAATIFAPMVVASAVILLDENTAL